MSSIAVRGEDSPVEEDVSEVVNSDEALVSQLNGIEGVVNAEAGSSGESLSDGLACHLSVKNESPNSGEESASFREEGLTG